MSDFIANSFHLNSAPPVDDDDDSCINVDFAAALTKELMKKFEGIAHEYGVNRRIMFGVLTRSGQQLLESCVEDRKDDYEAMFRMTEVVTDYKKHLEDLLGFTTSAEARLLSALTVADREDRESAASGAP